MASFKKVRLDGRDASIKTSADLEAKVPPNTQSLVITDINGNIAKIPRDKIGSVRIEEVAEAVTDLTDIDKGLGVEHLLMKEELPFLEDLFENYDGELGLEIFIRDEADRPLDVPYIEFQPFMLPDACDGIKFEPDAIDMIVPLENYPDYPPNGVFVKKDDPNRSNFERALGGHVYSQQLHYANAAPEKTYTEDLENDGWYWVCFHYRSGQWKFNPNDIRRGDCLAKYIKRLFDTLSGMK